MSLHERLKQIKKDEAYKKCFEDKFYKYSPIYDAIGSNHPNREVLFDATCVMFEKLTDDELHELKALTCEALDIPLVMPASIDEKLSFGDRSEKVSKSWWKFWSVS